MKYAILTLIILSSFSCKEDPYLKHYLKAEKLGDCINKKVSYKVDPNIHGERYEFEQCFANDFSEKQYTVERKGDTIIVKFNAKPGNNLYNMILELDVYPKYHFLQIGEEVLNVSPMGK